VGGTRTNTKPWLADHVVFFAYRWLSLGLTAALLLAYGRLAESIPILIVTGILNIPATLFAQRYVRIVQRNPILMAADIVYAVVVLLFSGGWESLFVFYAFGSLVLPALLFGWRGGVMAGLTFATIKAAALWAVGESPAALVAAEGGASLLLINMATPAIFGCIFPGAVELLRRAAARHGAPRRPATPAQRMEREIGADSVRFTAIGRTAGRGRESASGDAPLATQATKIRAAEQSVEDLRRVIFTPLPSPDMDLAAALDLLALRFDQQTNATARVTLLGRNRMINPIHRGILVRLAQEALLNIQQHAHADTAMLTLRYDATSVALMIQDDGVGLLDGTYERPGLHALRAMQYRLAEFGGRLDVFETEGGGVTVRATMPLE
jgi:hypothetical protein